jgi:hypothetical protein
MVFTNAMIAPSLGRNLAAGANATSTINLVQPGTLYGDRLTNIDLRLGKFFRVGNKRIQGSIDAYNLFNTNTPDGYTQTYATVANRWLIPTTVTPARFFRLSGQFDF